MSERPFDDITRAVLRPISDAADSAINTVTSTIGPAFTAGATLYVMYLGIQIMRGQSQETLTEATKTAIKLGVISTLVLNADMYRYWIVDVFSTAFADGIAKAFSGAPSADASRFDAVADKLWQMHARIWEGVSAWAPAKAFHATLLSGVLLICGLAFLVSAFITTLWAKAGMLYVLALGPVFLSLALFEQTKKYTAAFFDQVVSFVVLQVLVAALVGVCINAVDAEIQRPFSWARATSLVGGMVALLVFCNATVLLLPSLANKLSGGFSASFQHRAPAQQIAQVGEAFGQARFGDATGAGRALRGLAFGARDGDVNASQSAVSGRERSRASRSTPPTVNGSRSSGNRSAALSPQVATQTTAPTFTAMPTHEASSQPTQSVVDQPTALAPTSVFAMPTAASTVLPRPALNTNSDNGKPVSDSAGEPASSAERFASEQLVTTFGGRTETITAFAGEREPPADLEAFAPSPRDDEVAGPGPSETLAIPAAPTVASDLEPHARNTETVRPASTDHTQSNDQTSTPRRTM